MENRHGNRHETRVAIMQKQAGWWTGFQVKAVASSLYEASSESVFVSIA